MKLSLALAIVISTGVQGRIQYRREGKTIGNNVETKQVDGRSLSGMNQDAMHFEPQEDQFEEPIELLPIYDDTKANTFKRINRKSQTRCSKDKRVKISKFWINGDYENGTHNEHQLRLDGNKYFPNKASDCDQYYTGYCDWREGQAHNIANKAPWKKIAAYKTITVGTEEHNGIWGHVSHTTSLGKNDWYIDTCETYEVQLARDFKEQREKSLCWGVTGTLATELGKGGSGSVSGNVEFCETWTEPAESFIWLLEVEPAETFQFSKKYTRKWPHCVHIDGVGCLSGSRRDLENECKKHDDCTGFSFSTSSTYGWGCLKNCGNDDSFNGYGYGSHDYWEKKN
eukprot:CAMPEP_0178932126 /NCGR_PEP_ID=MMETSP0786-20121207/22400_1 /TAXON_ID=186022 /ORGANISM="Thalassionema frauenfeldii, Strain CCMP 1798" /LENGTH=340 /DNA_ID=CAMNT_0020609295 /DNA_START=822 /DNA_END=1844 /DNA_ORIENTATION=-